LAGSVVQLGLILLLGGLGIAAFHPEAAALAGASAPGDRSRAMSLFSVGGYVGQAIGPVISGVVSTRLGMPALGWGALVGFILLAMLGLGMSGPAPSTAPRTARVAPTPIAVLFRGRRRAVGV